MSSQPATYDPQASYRIELARVIRFEGMLLRGDITMTGAAIERLIAREDADVILSAEQI